MISRIKKKVLDYDDGFAQYLYVVVQELMDRGLIEEEVSAKDINHIADFFIYKVCSSEMQDWKPIGMSLKETVEFFQKNYDKSVKKWDE